MHEYDVALKSLLQRSLTGSVLADWAGVRIERWHNTDLPVVRSRRADLLGEDRQGNLFHVELQSQNDADMALRMIEYAIAIYRKYQRFPRQLVLYVGAAPLAMKTRLETPDLSFQCRMADIRELDTERLLASNHLEDNILAVLAGQTDRRELSRRILFRIAESPPAERVRAMQELTIISGLRNLAGAIIEEESRQMPILDDIMDHPVLGRERRRGIELGLKRGLEQGRLAGERHIVLNLLARRFGRLPAWAKKRIEEMTLRQLSRLCADILTASSLEDLLK